MKKFLRLFRGPKKGPAHEWISRNICGRQGIDLLGSGEDGRRRNIPQPWFNIPPDSYDAGTRGRKAVFPSG
jgi:hypothetical protein